jgi:dipeptidyl-peptidase-4
VIAGEHDSFPRQLARTQRFSLGRPRNFTISPDGSRVVFLRSNAGDDPVNRLWVLDVASGEERLVFEAPEEGDVSPEERARRERTRERAQGIVDYSTDRDVEQAAFAFGDLVFVVDLRGVRGLFLDERSPFDPRLDPDGARLAFVEEGGLRVLDLAGEEQVRVEEEDPNVSWGLAEFVAAEEMERVRGFWWSPDGTRVAATRVDESNVTELWIHDAVEPASRPRSVRFPLAGTANADVSLWILGLDGSRTEVRWDRERFEYLARVLWPDAGPLTVLVQSRDQRTTRILGVDDDGSTSTLREDTDERWVELIEGSPAYLDDGSLVATVDQDDTRRLLIDTEVVTPPGLQVRSILDAGESVLFTATEEPTEDHVWRWSAHTGPERLTDEPGVHTAVGHGDVVVVTSDTLQAAPTFTVHVKGQPAHSIVSHAEEPKIEATPVFFSAGSRGLRSALLTPASREPSEPMPVLLDPYGGPKFQRVMKTRTHFVESQWFADQGFVVLVIDGRGTPGRGPSWEREVHLGLLPVALEDQIEGLHAAADLYPFLDLTRVAIRGWSFGGEMAALAVIRHPEVFAAAICGAPATDHRLYDTHYTERYLGLPDEEPEAYARGSPLTEAATLERPILIVHGMSDDNVFVGHSLRLSRALLEAGTPHTFLPLSGATHMAKEPEVAENLLHLEVRFLRDALGLDRSES